MTARFDQEGAVAAANALSRQAQLGRIELQVGKVQDAVIPTLEVGGQPRQPTSQTREEYVVEPPDPGLCLAYHARPLPARARHDLQLRFDIDDAETGDQVALEPARDGDVEPPGLEVDQQRHQAVQPGAPQLQFLADRETQIEERDEALRADRPELGPLSRELIGN